MSVQLFPASELGPPAETAPPGDLQDVNTVSVQILNVQQLNTKLL